MGQSHGLIRKVREEGGREVESEEEEELFEPICIVESSGGGMGGVGMGRRKSMASQALNALVYLNNSPPRSRSRLSGDFGETSTLFLQPPSFGGVGGGEGRRSRRASYSLFDPNLNSSPPLIKFNSQTHLDLNHFASGKLRKNSFVCVDEGGVFPIPLPIPKLKLSGGDELVSQLFTKYLRT